MNLKELLKTKIVDFQKMIPYRLIQREMKIPVNSGKIITITGVRRSGKTFMLYQTINRLLRSGISKKQILFLSFDDERLNFHKEDFDLIFQAYKELFPEVQPADVYVFFDEIQVANHWGQFVRRIYDSETQHVYLSGSNSKLLATDIATSLRGRTIQYEIFPLSFSEYCDFKKIDKNDVHSSANRAILMNAANNFLVHGGFPEIVLTKRLNPEIILQEYYFVLLFKDVVERYQVKNIPVLKYFVARLVNNLTKPTAINKIYNEIKSAGLKTDKNMLYQLGDYLEAVYFSFRLKRSEVSVLKSELSTGSKIYFIDNGLLNTLSYSYYNEYGKLLENSLFLWLRRQIPFQRGLHYFKGKTECDFVVFDRDKPQMLIQSSWDMSDETTLTREIKGIVEAAQKFSCNKLYIVNSDMEKEITYSGYVIKIVPFWKFFLSFKLY